ncbi:MAG TPA: nickel ABC transporter permease [bacterium]|nr:nickel ABC transporter permease [bacterium]
MVIRAYAFKRILASVPVLLLVSIVVFGMVFMLPGDPLLALMEEVSLSPQRMDELREAMGLNDPIYVQYLRFFRNAIRGDLGRSTRSSQPVATILMAQIGSTLELAFAAVAISITLGIPFGVVAAIYRSRWTDSLVMVLSLLALSMPNFWLGFLLIILFSYNLEWLPSVGAGSVRQLILPALVLGLSGMGTLARITRSAMLDTLSQDYIRTARAKGLAEWVVLSKHALRNAFLPIMTLIGINMASVLSGAVVVETVFSRPGIGRVAISAIDNRDFPVVQGTVLLAAVFYVVVNLLVDLAYGLVDPRIRYD